MRIGEKNRYTIDFPSLTRCREFLGGHPAIIWVDSNSPKSYRLSVNLCARYFQREGYSDFCHYNLDYDDAICCLFIDKSYPQAVGAACFRQREYEDIEDKFWTMHWAWLHPFIRNNGILSNCIDVFNDKFGYWYPETPHSKAMVSFISKHKLVSPPKHFIKRKI